MGLVVSANERRGGALGRWKLFFVVFIVIFILLVVFRIDKWVRPTRAFQV